jgi:hypothetical protein
VLIAAPLLAVLYAYKAYMAGNGHGITQ